MFARGQPEILGTCLLAADTILLAVPFWEHKEPRWLDLYCIPEARLRILRLLAQAPDGRALDQPLPELAEAAQAQTQSVSKRRSAWTSTFVAGLELAK